MSKTACVPESMTGVSFPLSGATVAFKHGSIRDIVTLPPNKSDSAINDLDTFIQNYDKLTEYNFVSATSAILTTGDSTVPDDEPGKQHVNWSATIKKFESGSDVPGFKLSNYIRLHEANTDIAYLSSVSNAQKQYTNLQRILYGSTFGQGTTKFYNESDPNIVAGAGGNPSFGLSSTLYDTGPQDLDVLPPGAFRMRIGDRTYFLVTPTLRYSSGAIVDTYDVQNDTLIDVLTYNPHNLSAIYDAGKILAGFTRGKILAWSMSLFTNSNVAYAPTDRVGKEAIQKVTFRTQSNTTPTDIVDNTLLIRGYSNWSNMNDAAIQTCFDGMKQYYASIYSTDGTDNVRVMF